MVSHLLLLLKPCYNKYSIIGPVLHGILPTGNRKEMPMLFLIFFALWSIIGTIVGLILKIVFRVLPIKTIIVLCLIGYGLHMLGIHIL